MQYTLNISLDEESESIGQLFKIEDVDGAKTTHKLRKLKVDSESPAGLIRNILNDDTLSDEQKIYYLLVFGYNQGVEKVLLELRMDAD